MYSCEKVIKGLECCLLGQLEGLGCDRVPCPYNEFEDCEGMLHRDALALLKAQQPHVMALEEACRDIEIWYESINGACGYGDLCYDANADLAIYTPHGIRGVKEYAYGKTWRCWTSRPDEKVRAETPWGT